MKITEITEEKIKELLEIENKKMALDDSDWNTYHLRNYDRLKALLEIVKSGVKFKYDMEFRWDDSYLSMDGTVLIEDKFIFALLSKKWKVVGKNVWYRSRGPTHFIERFVRGNK